MYGMGYGGMCQSLFRRDGVGVGVAIIAVAILILIALGVIF